MWYYLKKAVIIIMVICFAISIFITVRIIINKRFIGNYPESDQEFRLVLLSTFNYYEPYIAPYNYGNYLYQKERYEDAYKKYKKALTYKIPKRRLCPITINIGLSLVKMSEENSTKDKSEYLKEAQWYLQKCLSLNPNDENPDDYFEEEIGEYDGQLEKEDQPGHEFVDEPGESEIGSQQKGASDLSGQIGQQESGHSDDGGEKDGEKSKSDGKLKEIDDVTSKTDNGGDPDGTGHEKGNDDGGISDTGTQMNPGCHNCG